MSLYETKIVSVYLVKRYIDDLPNDRKIVSIVDLGGKVLVVTEEIPNGT